MESLITDILEIIFLKVLYIYIYIYPNRQIWNALNIKISHVALANWIITRSVKCP